MKKPHTSHALVIAVSGLGLALALLGCSIRIGGAPASAMSPPQLVRAQVERDFPSFDIVSAARVPQLF